MHANTAKVVANAASTSNVVNDIETIDELITANCSFGRKKLVLKEVLKDRVKHHIIDRGFDVCESSGRNSWFTQISWKNPSPHKLRQGITAEQAKMLTPTATIDDYREIMKEVERNAEMGNYNMLYLYEVSEATIDSLHKLGYVVSTITYGFNYPEPIAITAVSWS